MIVKLDVRKIVVVGGHHTPALAVIKSLQDEAPKCSLRLHFFWIGHRFSMWADRRDSAEYRDVKSLGLPFFDLQAGKFHNTLHPLKLARIPLGFLQAFLYLTIIRPQLVISFGGYLAVPVVISAWLIRVPVVTHEQTTVAGTASLLIAKFARRIFVSFPTSIRFFPKGKTALVGNPLRDEIFIDRGLFDLGHGKRTIYITGGKQGSHVINRFVGDNLERLLSYCNVIHQCGSSSVHDDYSILSTLAQRLPTAVQGSYLLKDFFVPEEIGSVFARASVIVSRSGANTIYEIGALGKPALLIPIPWSSHQEQLSNARFLAGGGAIVLEEQELNEERFFASLERIFSSYDQFKSRAQEFSKQFPRQASLAMAQEIISLLRGF